MKNSLLALLLSLISLPVLAVPKPTDPIIVYKIDSTDNTLTYTKPFKYIRLDPGSMSKLNAITQKMKLDDYHLYAIRVSNSLDIAMYKRADGIAFKTYTFIAKIECAMYLDAQDYMTSECSQNGKPITNS